MRLFVLSLLASAFGAAQGFQPGNSLFPQRTALKSPTLGGNKPELNPIISLLPATAADTPSEPWTKPRLHNNPLVRSGALLAALALAGASSPFSKLPSAFAATLHLLSFATWFGSVFYTTFIAGITMFKALPRQTFGKVQSKLFPKYFSLCSMCIVIQVRSIEAIASSLVCHLSNTVPFHMQLM